MGYYAHYPSPTMYPSPHAQQPWAGPGGRSTSPSSMQVYIPVTIPLAFDEAGGIIVPTLVEEDREVERQRSERRSGSRQKKKSGKGSDRESKRDKRRRDKSARSSPQPRLSDGEENNREADSMRRSPIPRRRRSRRLGVERSPTPPHSSYDKYDKTERDTDRRRYRDTDHRHRMRFTLKWVRALVPGIPPPSYASPPVSPIATTGGSYFAYPPSRPHQTQYHPTQYSQHQQVPQYRQAPHHNQTPYTAQPVQYQHRPIYRRHSSLEWAMRKLSPRDRSPARHAPTPSPTQPTPPAAPLSPSRSGARTPTPQAPTPQPQPSSRPRPLRSSHERREDGAGAKLFDTVASACAECARRAAEATTRAGRALAPTKKVRFADGGVPGAQGYALG